MPSSAEQQLVPIARWLFGASHCARDDVALKARLLLLDTIGCAFAGFNAPVVRSLAESLAATQPGEHRFPHLSGLGTAAATELFATGAVWDEACEGLARAHGRPGVAVIAACLPIAVQRSASLGALLDAITTGYEIGARMGEWLRIRPGMHVDAGWPALGVAASVAHINRRSADEALTAIAIAGCQVPFGLYAPVRAGATARNTYLAHAAMLGLLAARAAASGMDAPSDATSDYATIALGLPRFENAGLAIKEDRAPLAPVGELLILQSYLKPFAAVRHVHYGATAALQLRERLYARLGEVASIELSIYDEAITYCGNRDPQTPIAAQFSLSFGLAAALRFGELTPAVYRDNRFGEVGLRRLERMVGVNADPARSARGERGATLTIRTAKETFAATVTTIKGDPTDPMRADEVRAKFLDYTTGRVESSAAARFADQLITGPLEQSMAAIWRSLCD